MGTLVGYGTILVGERNIYTDQHIFFMFLFGRWFLDVQGNVCSYRLKKKYRVR